MKLLHRGFTIVELLIVIVIISLLAGIATLSYGSWQTRLAESSVKSELKSAFVAMKNTQNFSGAFPATVPYTPGANVTFTMISNSTSAYCLRGTSVLKPTVIFYLTHASGEPTSTACT